MPGSLSDKQLLQISVQNHREENDTSNPKYYLSHSKEKQ